MPRQGSVGDPSFKRDPTSPFFGSLVQPWEGGMPCSRLKRELKGGASRIPTAKPIRSKDLQGTN
ncbi:hypothetical protein DsansV1_C07g0072471 [Dioscorea sansibarensis]